MSSLFFSLPVLSQPSTPQSTLADQTSLPFCSLHSPCLFLFFPLLLVNLPLISTFYHYHHVFCTSPLFNSGHTQLYFKSRDFPNHQLLILLIFTNLPAPSSRSILLYITSQNTCHIVSTTFFSYANYLLYLPTDSVLPYPISYLAYFPSPISYLLFSFSYPCPTNN